MKCKHIREEIDTASRHTLYSNSVTTHLSGCPDCGRHADGTASLLNLLSAQPRVEAPADFDAKLSMGIARAQAEGLNDKTASLLSLLKAQPRVEAPADFDFRLSAGIARAQAEGLNQSGLFERAWEKLARSLTFGQATAMAAAALVVVTVSTFYINQDKGAPAAPRNVAMTIPAEPKPSRVEAVREITTPAVDSVRTITAKSSGRGVRVRPAVFENDLQANNNQPDAFSKVYNQKTKQ